MRERDSINLYGERERERGGECGMGTDEVKGNKDEEEVRREDEIKKGKKQG